MMPSNAFECMPGAPRCRQSKSAREGSCKLACKWRWLWHENGIRRIQLELPKSALFQMLPTASLIGSGRELIWEKTRVSAFTSSCIECINFAGLTSVHCKMLIRWDRIDGLLAGWICWVLEFEVLADVLCISEFQNFVCLSWLTLSINPLNRSSNNLKVFRFALLFAKFYTAFILHESLFNLSIKRATLDSKGDPQNVFTPHIIELTVMLGVKFTLWIMPSKRL